MGQTSLLGSLHIELAPPTDVAPQGRLHDGSLIPLSSGGAYPTTEQTLAAISLLLNGGGIGQIQDITKAFSTAFAGREHDLRSLIEQLDKFIALPQRPDRRHHRRHRQPQQAGRSVRRPETRGGQGAEDHPGRAGRAQRRAGQPGRRARSAGQVQRAGRRLGQPDQGRIWSRNSKTSAPCCSRWPTPGRR